MTATFKTADSSKITISELMLPSHTNFSGKIHGGYILMLMDQIAFAAASKFSGCYCVTASVDTVDKDAEGKNALVPHLILSTDDEVRRFCKAVVRINQKKEHGKHAQTFDYK